MPFHNFAKSLFYKMAKVFDLTKPRNESSRHWMGVIYNPNDKSKHHGMDGFDNMGECLLENLKDLVDKDIKYYCHGFEICPTTSTEHLQCYFLFKEKNTLSSLRKKFEKWLHFPCTISFKVADGNVKSCVDYCLKDKNNCVEVGTLPVGAGKRSDLDAVISCINSGGNINTVAVLHPSVFIKCGTGISKWISQIAVPRDFKTEVYWIWGPTGTGKSRWVMNTVDRTSLYMKSGANKWWCNYADQKNVLWDDFRPSKEVPFEFLLRLFDRFPLQVEGKGCTLNFAPERIFITTPKPPVETFAHWEHLGQENLQQLLRRLTKVIEFQDVSSFQTPLPLEPFIKCSNVWTNHRSLTGSSNIEEISDITPTTHLAVAEVAIQKCKRKYIDIDDLSRQSSSSSIDLT